MGYSEVLCDICGVSFNIGRIRSSTEQRSGAWSRFGPMLNAAPWTEPPDLRESYVINDVYQHRSDCPPGTGCMIAMRKTVYPKILSSAQEDEEDDSEDVDWVDDGGEEDEPLEYCSDDEALEKTTSGDVEMCDASDNEEEEEEEEEIEANRQFWLGGMFKERDGPQDERGGGFATFASNGHESLPAWFRETPHWMIELPDENDIIDEMRPMYEPGTTTPVEPYANESEEGKEFRKNMKYMRPYWRDVEHIAGPGCESRHGYHGDEITEAEMRMCLTSQCLVRKPPGWSFEPESDDEDFEKMGGFFLSGLSDHMPSRDYNNPRVIPPRHGCDSPHAENFMWDEDSAIDYALPFHPYCFEVYKRTSLLLSGKVSVSALTSWWSLESDYEHFHRFPRHPDVDKNAHQEWQHEKGTAYLVANPLYIPKLGDIFQAAVETDPNFDPRGGAFSIQVIQRENTSTDPFALLPGELQFEILDALSSKDIAALRLSSRSLSQLPVSYFQKLILREMPWLWEAWPTSANPSPMKYAKWATGTSWDLRQLFDKFEKEKAILNDYINIIKEDFPEASPVLDAASPVHYEAIESNFHAECEKSGVSAPFFLPPRQTNYFKLYTLIMRHWAELRGLQNRKRIWKDCSEILKRVEAYKEEGKIDENGMLMEEVTEIIRRHNAEQRRRVRERDRIYVEEREAREREMDEERKKRVQS